jgi:preprotein translocase subunit SecF
MKRIIPFSKGFLPAALISTFLAVVGIIGYSIMGGFNLGVDFQAGLIQEIRFAPPAFTMTWSGRGNAAVSFDRDGLYIAVFGTGLEGAPHSFPFAEYRTLDALIQALNRIEGLNARILGDGGIDTQSLIYSAQASPQLGAEEPYVVHYQNQADRVIGIQEVRDSLISLGESVSVQQVGDPLEQHYLIRVIFEENGETKISSAQLIQLLGASFSRDNLVLIRSDEVAERFSKDLTRQAGVLLALTLGLILVYASIRFKPQYAVGAVAAIIHDALIMVAFIAWTRMEFNTTTIAAILTTLGYSINDTIVIFDRIRETRRIYPDDAFVDVLNRALSETLGRTFITTFTTMLAVLSLYVFTTGSMKDFALALLVGMVSGVYSTVFIASGLVYFWDLQKTRREKKKLAVPAAGKA